MNFIELKIKDLKPSEYNPRMELTNEDEEYQNIKRSIQNFGYVEPIIVNKDKTIIGGHQRYNVLKDLGYDKINCVIDLNKNKEKALNIALNKISGFWDNEKLSILLKELKDLEIVNLTGFSEDEVNNYLDDMNIDEFYTSEENQSSSSDKADEKECPECGTLINIKNWKVVE